MHRLSFSHALSVLSASNIKIYIIYFTFEVIWKFKDKFWHSVLSNTDTQLQNEISDVHETHIGEMFFL